MRIDVVEKTLEKGAGLFLNRVSRTWRRGIPGDRRLRPCQLLDTAKSRYVVAVGECFTFVCARGWEVNRIARRCRGPGRCLALA